MTDPYINAIYSFFSFGTAKYTGLRHNPPLPPAISVELSSICNLSCPECVTGSGQLKRKKGFMDILLAQKIAGELSATTISSFLYFQGEPLMHPQFLEIVRMYAKMNPVISTNGHFLDEKSCQNLALSGLKKIIISYDGISQDTYSIYRRGGDLASVTAGIHHLMEAVRRNGLKVAVELQFLIGRHNEHEVKAAGVFARSVGASFSVKTMQVLDKERNAIWTPANRKWSRYSDHDGSDKNILMRKRGCFRLWATSVITVEGDVLPCCYDKNAEYVMGNLNRQSFRDIWNGERYNSFRAAVMKERSSIRICSGCDQGRKLKFRHP